MNFTLLGFIQIGWLMGVLSYDTLWKIECLLKYKLLPDLENGSKSLNLDLVLPHEQCYVYSYLKIMIYLLNQFYWC